MAFSNPETLRERERKIVSFLEGISLRTGGGRELLQEGTETGLMGCGRGAGEGL